MLPYILKQDMNGAYYQLLAWKWMNIDISNVEGKILRE